MKKVLFLNKTKIFDVILESICRQERGMTVERQNTINKRVR
jgi:hypothetical protein